MREMKDSGIAWLGNIPSSWMVEKVKHGFYRKKTEAHQDNPIVLSLARSGVKERDISNNEGQIAESYYNYNPVEKDDLLINPMDLYSGANCSISKIQGVISPAYVNLRFKNGYNPEYYDYYFKIQYWMMAFFAHGKGVSFDNRWTLNAETLMNYPIIVPSYEEQCAIVDYISAKCSQIDFIISKQETIIEKLKEYKLSIITEAISKGLDLSVELKDSGIDWIGSIPAHWRIGNIKRVTKKIGSGKTPKGGAEIYSSEGVLFLRSQNIYDEGLVLDNPTFITKEIDDEMKNTRVYPGDVLLNITGGSIGRCCVFPESIGQANVNQHVSIIRVIDSLCTPDFMHYYWISEKGKTAINLYQTGGNREGMSAEAIGNTSIAIPPLKEQKEITSYIDNKICRLDSLINNLKSMNDKLIDYKRSLIFSVVTGKKEV